MSAQRKYCTRWPDRRASGSTTLPPARSLRLRPFEGRNPPANLAALVDLLEWTGRVASDMTTVVDLKTRRGQTLLIDADDTLWENNIYFEEATEEFIDYLDHTT